MVSRFPRHGRRATLATLGNPRWHFSALLLMQQPHCETGVLGYARLTLGLRESIKDDSGDMNGYFAFPGTDALYIESQ